MRFTFTRLTAAMLFPLLVLSTGWSPTASAASGCDGVVQCRSNTGGGYSGSGSSSNDTATSQAIQQGGEMLIQMLEKAIMSAGPSRQKRNASSSRRSCSGSRKSSTSPTRPGKIRRSTPGPTGPLFNGAQTLLPRRPIRLQV